MNMRLRGTRVIRDTPRNKEVSVMSSSTLTPLDLGPKLQEYERQIRVSAALAQLQAGTPPQGMPTGLRSALPEMPPPPDPGKWLQILGRYAVEAILHLPDSMGLAGDVLKLVTTPDGMKMLERLRAALIEQKADAALFTDFLKYLGGGGAGYKTLQLGVATEARGVAGLVGVTGVAIPTTGEGRVKWFSGLEQSTGLALELSASLLIGRKLEAPEHLSGGFYGAHVGLDIGASFGSNIYFDTSPELKYTGFVATVGVGFGAGISVLRGVELVTSD
jgi:hypothetical protein